MTDREKVIKGLEICTSRPCYCTGCPYKANCCLDSQEVMEDALALLKEQEPRVVTLDEIKEGESYWFQRGQMLVTRPVVCVYREDDTPKPYITFAWQFGTFSWESEDYGKTWRCWSAKPTNEQSEAVKWE